MTHQKLSSFFISFFMFVPFFGHSAVAVGGDLEAEQLLREVYAQYPKLKTYSDEGVVRVTSYSAEKVPYKYKKAFLTRYSAPDSLLFAWVENVPSIGIKEYAVWGAGSDIKSWAHFRGLRKESSWSTALSAAHGISSGVASLIPRNLLSSCPNDPLERVVNVEFVNVPSANTESEVTLKVKYSNYTEDLVSVDSERKLITKVEYWMEHPTLDHRTHTVITFANIITNEPIEIESLQFKPANNAPQPTQ